MHRPHRRLKLRGDPREIAVRILELLGFRRLAPRQAHVYVGWIVFLVGLVLVPLAYMSSKWTSGLSPGEYAFGCVAAMLLTCAIGLVVVARGRRRVWFRSPSGGILRLDGAKTSVITDESSDRIVGEWTFPEPPPQESSVSLSPHTFAGMVREIADLASREAGDAPLTGLTSEQTGVQRSWILLGELADRLRGGERDHWERGIRLPGWVAVALLIVTVGAGFLAWQNPRQYVPSASASLLLTLGAITAQKAWGRCLRYGKLRLTDRYENDQWTITIRGPNEWIEESLPAETLVDEHLVLVDPAPLDALAARANALLA